MKYVELFDDPASVARGEELTAIFVEARELKLTRQRQILLASTIFPDTVNELVQKAIEDGVVSESPSHINTSLLSQLGSRVLEAKQNELELQAELAASQDSEDWEAIFANTPPKAFDFLRQHKGRPIAAKNIGASGLIHKKPGAEEIVEEGSGYLSSTLKYGLTGTVYIDYVPQGGVPRYALSLLDLQGKPNFDIAIGE